MYFIEICVEFRDFLRSKKKMWDFKSADTEATKRKNYILIVFKDNIKVAELPPELKTYKKLNLCIHPSPNLDKIAARVRYSQASVLQLHKIYLLFQLLSKSASVLNVGQIGRVFVHGYTYILDRIYGTLLSFLFAGSICQECPLQN